MMWISIPLLFLSSYGEVDKYWAFVSLLESQGCRVYNVFYESCPGPHPLRTVEIPSDAVEVFAPIPD